jgi:hypothetical protein
LVEKNKGGICPLPLPHVTPMPFTFVRIIKPKNCDNLACIIDGKDKFKENLMGIILENTHFENQGGDGMRYQDDHRKIIWARRR